MPRGSDQYWSLANVERVIHVDGKFSTNNIFPAGMPANLDDLPRPWVQNRPVVYLVIGAAWIFGNAQHAWLFSNFLFVLLTGLMMIRIFKYSDTRKASGIIAFAFLLFFPLNFYLVMQALPEQFNQLLVMLLFMLMILHKGNYLSTFAAALTGGLLLYQRDNYLLLLVLIPLYFLWNRERSWLIHALLFIGIMGLMYFIKPILLPSHTIKEIPLLNLIAEVRPGNHNMINYLHPEWPARPLPEVIKIIGIKLVNAISKQFAVNDANALFTYSMNFLLIPFIILLFRIRQLDTLKRKGVLLTAIFVLIHIATIVLFENQYRFSAVLIPLLIICAVWWTQSLRSFRMVMPIAAWIILVMIITDAAIGYINRKEAIKDQKDIVRYQEFRKNQLHEQPVMIHWTDGKSLLASYGLLPNYCYYFPGDASGNDLLKIAGRLGTGTFIVKQGSGVYSQLKPLAIHEEMIQPDKQFVLLELPVKTR